MFAGQLAAQRFTHAIDVATVQLAGGVGEIDIFEDAEGLAWQAYQRLRVHSVLIERDQFSWLDLAYKGGANPVEGARFGGHHPAHADASDTERAHPPGVAHGVEFAFGQYDQTIGADQLRVDGDHTLAQRWPFRVEQEPGHGFAVGGRV